MDVPGLEILHWSHGQSTATLKLLGGAVLATKHGLRSLDAIHLAAAIAMRHSDPDADFAVACFDTRLCSAMRAEGLPLLSADGSAPGG